MLISRRGFLATVRNTAGVLGLGALELGTVEELLANPNAPTVLWLQGAACSGCSVSFLNYISATAPKTAADVLLTTVNVAYQSNVSTASGDLARSVLDSALAKGGYVLIVEGGIPTAFNGLAAIAWTDAGGKDVTFQQAVLNLAGRASQVISFGTCASFGGVPSAPPNPAGIKSVRNVTLKPALNIPGCPPHPNWMVWAIVNTLAKTVGPLDSYGRPTALYGRTVHSQCPRRDSEDASTYGQDRRCMEEMGCFGPSTYAVCPTMKWNNAQNWCVDANSQCIGCVNPNFPATTPLRRAHGD